MKNGRIDEITHEGFMDVIIGFQGDLGLSPLFLIFTAKTFCHLCHISFFPSVSSRKIGVVVSILHVFCKFMQLHSLRVITPPYVS